MLSCDLYDEVMGCHVTYVVRDGLSCDQELASNPVIYNLTCDLMVIVIGRV